MKVVGKHGTTGRRKLATLLTLALVGSALTGVGVSRPADATASITASFSALNCTGWNSVTAPSGAISATFTLTGGGGAGGDNKDSSVGGTGGRGAVVVGEVAVSPGNKLWAKIGCGGIDGPGQTAGYANGGDSRSYTGGGGGAASALCLGSASACSGGSVIAIAAGGGGGGSGEYRCTTSNNGGNGGNANGGTQSTGGTSGENGGNGWGGARGGNGQGSPGSKGGGGAGGTGQGPGQDTGTNPGNNSPGIAGDGFSSGGHAAENGTAAAASPPADSPTAGTGQGGSSGGEDDVYGGGGGGGLGGGGGGGGGRNNGSCFSQWDGASGGGAGSSWVKSTVTGASFGSAGGNAVCDSGDPTSISASNPGYGGPSGLCGRAGYITVTWTVNSTSTAFTTAPSSSGTAGVPLASQPVVRATNGATGVPGEQITLTYTGTSSGTVTCAQNPLSTDASGYVTFSGCRFLAAGTYQIKATNGTTGATATTGSIVISSNNSWSGYTPTLPQTCGSTANSYALPSTATALSTVALGGAGGGSGAESGGSYGGAGGAGHSASAPQVQLPSTGGVLDYPRVSYRLGCAGTGGQFKGGTGTNGNAAGGTGGAGWGNGGAGGNAVNTGGSNKWVAAGGAGGGGSVVCLAAASDQCGGSSYVPLLVAAGGGGGGGGRSNGGGGNGGADGGGNGAGPVAGSSASGNEAWYGGSVAGTGLGGTGGEGGRWAGGGGGGGGTGGKGGNGTSSGTGGNGGANNTPGNTGTGSSTTYTTPTATSTNGGAGGDGGSRSGTSDAQGGGGGGGGYQGGGGGSGADADSTAGAGGGNASSWGATSVGGQAVVPTFNQAGGGSGAARNSSTDGDPGTQGALSFNLSGNGILLSAPANQSSSARAPGLSVSLPSVQWDSVGGKLSTPTYTASGLPSGWSVNPSTGAVSGTGPATTGVYTITITGSTTTAGSGISPASTVLSHSVSFTWTFTNAAPTGENASGLSGRLGQKVRVFLKGADSDGLTFDSSGGQSLSVVTSNLPANTSVTCGARVAQDPSVSKAVRFPCELTVGLGATPGVYTWNYVVKDDVNGGTSSVSYSVEFTVAKRAAPVGSVSCRSGPNGGGSVVTAVDSGVPSWCSVSFIDANQSSPSPDVNGRVITDTPQTPGVGASVALDASLGGDDWFLTSGALAGSSTSCTLAETTAGTSGCAVGSPVVFRGGGTAGLSTGTGLAATSVHEASAAASGGLVTVNQSCAPNVYEGKSVASPGGLDIENNALWDFYAYNMGCGANPSQQWGYAYGIGTPDPPFTGTWAGETEAYLTDEIGSIGTDGFGSWAVEISTDPGTNIKLLFWGKTSVQAPSFYVSAGELATQVQWLSGVYTVDVTGPRGNYRVPQTITFPTFVAYAGQTVTLGATTTASNLDVSYAVSGPGCGTLNGDQLTFTTVGASCKVTASQPGDTSWAPASSVSRTVKVKAIPQTITATWPAGPFTAGDTALLDQTMLYTLSPTAGDLPVSLTVTAGACTLDGGAGPVVVPGSGSVTVAFPDGVKCKIVASQGGDGTYAAAGTKTWSVTPKKKTGATVDFDQPSTPRPLANDVTITGVMTNPGGLTVTFTTSGSSGCQVINNTTVTTTQAGTCSIKATAVDPANVWATVTKTRTVKFT